MNIFQAIKESFCKEELKEIKELKEALEKSDKDYEDLLNKLDEEKISQERGDLAEFYWNNKWVQSPITYKAQGKVSRDVRNLILDKSYILEEVLTEIKKDAKNDDEIALNALKWIRKNIKYKKDNETHLVAEYWQDPEETYSTRTGDCEDGALLLASIMLIAGIPSYKIKLCAGYVKQGKKKAGHAYVIYLADNYNKEKDYTKYKWYILDWCYWSLESINNFNKTPHKEMKNYEEIWWTINNKFSWSEEKKEV